MNIPIQAGRFNSNIRYFEITFEFKGAKMSA